MKNNYTYKIRKAGQKTLIQIFANGEKIRERRSAKPIENIEGFVVVEENDGSCFVGTIGKLNSCQTDANKWNHWKDEELRAYVISIDHDKVASDNLNHLAKKFGKMLLP
ncbi:hypothetical protein KXP31_000305 [Staphylococcus pseudintermedius]|nr:hypothetical protein [Staphylococcus pseudintermedius]